ncbi:ubiquitin [Aplysia californica]|uniref:Ubiquitin n=1 Tax=Aplysia californica TaxID=6500 RepID=A0ABM1VWF0_APLCA|nr:ubiquitin [Aplysia californica]XP_035826742.1 ubiquitin [Aplysia californica]
MVLFVQSQQTHVLDLSQQKTIEDVKALVTDREGLPTEEMAVFYEGQPLEDSCELYSFKNEATLHVELRMLGGKVHGSLARAGKVRGQTPKVDKQEKKKSKTGRAKRRMQYNRRFVNVVSGFGRKKGPNARS